MNELAGQAKDVAGRGEQDKVIFGTNKPPPKEADIQEAARDLDVNTNPQEKIRTAICCLENEKSPGQDNLGAEVFKADPQLAADLLQPLLRDIWEEKKLPEDRTEGVIEKIPKKRCPQELQEVARNHLTICTQQDPGQDHRPANSQDSGPTPEKIACRLLERKGMHRPDLYPA